MDPLQKAGYAATLKANPKANEPLGFENFDSFKETLWKFQKLLELPEFHQLFRECAPKTVEYIWGNYGKVVEGKEMEFFENFMGGTT